MSSENTVTPEFGEMLRKYANHEMTWYEMRNRGVDSYWDVLWGLGQLGLKYPVARMIGPNVESRQRGIGLLRELGRIRERDAGAAGDERSSPKP